MDRTEYSLLICGATLAGLGAAAAASEAKRDVIVVERTSLVGREFIEAFNPGSGWGKPATDFGRNVRNDWVERNLMEENGPVHLPGLHPVLCLHIKRYGLKVRFLTEIVGIAERDGRYEVLLQDASGCRPMLVGEILDTSTERLTVPGQLVVPGSKRLNAYLHHPDLRNAAIPAPFDESMTVCRGRFPSEVILKVNVAPGADWLEARQRLHRFWQARPAEWASWTIAAVAGTFDSTVPGGLQRLGERWSWLPSEAFANPLSAIDQGYGSYTGTEGKRDAAKAGK
ncbi:hypothetical protein FE783_17010 [Paenibacillus mesophilus]|uniref:hypothetical protein n=1 Tax=Paenibacillus mesophilus TaxID=2582849 RepID=UPI00110EDEBE|nr:hypothetical protein [Paenibacillus mesophilus]TMV48745.1 hypothetical protein FE783_17010 [Paenibacillus mesophilus]